MAVAVAAFTFYAKSQQPSKPPAIKKQEIIEGYRQQLQNALAGLHGDETAYMDKKREVMKEINAELSRNIFFDQTEIREVLQELSRNS